MPRQDRRSFLKWAAASAAGVAVAGCKESSPVIRRDGSVLGSDGSIGGTRDGGSDMASEAAPADLVGGEEASVRTRPNVLFVFDDQLRADVCGVYGGRNITTPNIDRLAAQGVVFSNAVSSCPLCTPYRGMVQTGRYPTHSGVIMNFLEASQAQNPNCLANVLAAAHDDFRPGPGFGEWFDDRRELVRTGLGPVPS